MLSSTLCWEDHALGTSERALFGHGAWVVTRNELGAVVWLSGACVAGVFGGVRSLCGWWVTGSSVWVGMMVGLGG